MVFPQLTIDLAEALAILGPLALIIGGITVYGVFVFNFYRFLARKDIFTLDLQKHNQAKRPALRKTVSVIFYTVKCLVLYPVFVFFWFFIMAVLLYFLSRNQSVEVVMLVAMGVVGAIRVCSYYKEALATDISKILPFALLGIMLIDNSVIRLVESTESVRDVALQWDTVLSLSYYLAFVVSLEFLLRMTSGAFNYFRSRRRSRKERKSQPKPEVARPAEGPQFGAAGSGAVFEPRPTGRGSAPPMTPGRVPSMSARPSFIQDLDYERSGTDSETPDRGAGSPIGDMPEPRDGVRRSRPAYAPAFSTEMPASEYRSNGGYRLG